MTKSKNQVLSIGPRHVCLAVWCDGRWRDAHGPLTWDQRQRGDRSQAKHHGAAQAVPE